MKNLKNILVGGGLVSKGMVENDSMLYLFGMSLLILLIKGLLVMVTYNFMAPKIAYNLNTNYEYRKFRRVSLLEGILLVILFTNLFNHY